MATNTNRKLAVLIDADNAQASVIQELYMDAPGMPSFQFMLTRK